MTIDSHGASERVKANTRLIQLTNSRFFITRKATYPNRTRHPREAAVDLVPVMYCDVTQIV